MSQEQFILYIRENTMMTALIAGGVILFLLLVILIQVATTRHEVRKICKKIRKYFDVILEEDEKAVSKEVQSDAATGAEIPVYQTREEVQRQQEERKKAEDAKLLMDVIQEVF